MPRKVLTDPEAGSENAPGVGFFGKLPSTGDFVSRGLPDAFRRKWDAWLTRHVAPLHRGDLPLPPGGLRFRLPSGGRLAAGVILPSKDSAGRHFPISLVLIVEGNLSQHQIDSWCGAALDLPVLTLSPDDLWRALDALPAPEAEGPATPPMELWTPGRPALAVDPADPAPHLRHLLAP